MADWALLAAIPDDERREVLSLARRRRFARNEVIFHEGDPGDAMHLVDRGRVAIKVTTPLGEHAMLTVLGPGGFFGEMALVDARPRNATVLALEPAETLALHREHVDELRRRFPSIDRLLVQALVAEVRRVSHQLLEALYVPVDKRVLRRVLDLAALYPSENGVTTIPLTQEDVAQLAGTTRPTANKALRAAEEQGALRIARGRIEIVDTDAISRRAR